MKTIKIFIACTLLVVSAFCAAFVNGNAKVKPPTIQNLNPAGFAVLELFTSEGCSSCPQADELLGKIQAEFKNKPVYVLAYHVDYWDRTGWKDPFSDALYSNRQFGYSKLFGTPMYTPQVVFNGESEFVGSDGPRLRQTLTASLKGKAPETFSITGDRESNSVKLHYQFTDEVKGNVLHVAIVQNHVTNHVKRGENEGRHLVHWQTVRQLYKFPLSTNGEGNEQIRLPGAFDSTNWEIIGWIQNPKTGKISAAGSVAFARESSVPTRP